MPLCRRGVCVEGSQPLATSTSGNDRILPGQSCFHQTFNHSFHFPIIPIFHSTRETAGLSASGHAKATGASDSLRSSRFNPSCSLTVFPLDGSPTTNLDTSRHCNQRPIDEKDLLQCRCWVILDLSLSSSQSWVHPCDPKGLDAGPTAV